MSYVEDFEKIIENSRSKVAPSVFPDDLEIGACDYRSDDLKRKLFIGVSNLKEFESSCGVECWLYLHTHGFEIQNNDIRYCIHSSQIISVDVIHIDETFEFDRKDNRERNMLLAGGLLGGHPMSWAIGGALGYVFSAGKSTKHIVCNQLVISFWDISDKSYKFIAFDEEKDASPESLPDFKDTFDTFKDYFKNKIAANRGLAPGKNENGCLSSILLIISSSMALLSVLLYVVFL